MYVLGILKMWSVEITGRAKGWLGQKLAGTDAGCLCGAFGTAEIPSLEGKSLVTYFHNLWNHSLFICQCTGRYVGR